MTTTAPPAAPTTTQHGESGPIRATAPMWRCSKIMHMQREIHPTILSSLEGIVDQVRMLGFLSLIYAHYFCYFISLSHLEISNHIIFLLPLLFGVLIVFATFFFGYAGVIFYEGIINHNACSKEKPDDIFSIISVYVLIL